MIEMRRRTVHSARSCATCHYLRHVATSPNSECPAEFYCGASDVSLVPHANSLAYVFCVNWDSLPDDKAREVFKELTGMEL